jgi:hypothetical protein
MAVGGHSLETSRTRRLPESVVPPGRVERSTDTVDAFVLLWAAEAWGLGNR